MEVLKQSEFKSGQVVEFEYQGATHEGVVEVERKSIFICQNAKSGSKPKNMRGFKCGYIITNFGGGGFMSRDSDDLKNIRLKSPATSPKKPRAKIEVERIGPVITIKGVEYRKGFIGANTRDAHVAKIYELVEERKELTERITSLRAETRTHARLNTKKTNTRSELD